MIYHKNKLKVSRHGKKKIQIGKEIKIKLMNILKIIKTTCDSGQDKQQNILKIKKLLLDDVVI